MLDYKKLGRIKQTQNGWKGVELSENSKGKVLHKVFKYVVNEIKLH